MDIRYLYSFLQNIDDDDEKIDLIENVHEQFKESDIMNLIPCLKLFQDEESAASFFSTALQYFKLTHKNDSYIDIIQSFSPEHRYTVFCSCNNNYIVPHDFQAMRNVLLMMNNDEDMVKVVGYYSDIHVNDQLGFCDFLSEIFSSYSEFKKACIKLHISDLISENFRDIFIKRNYRIIINDKKMPYVRIGDKRSFSTNGSQCVIENTNGNIRISIDNKLVFDSSGDYHFVKIEC
jgi:hypothetical protein